MHDIKVLRNRLERVDWDFANYSRREPGYLLHWYPARVVGAIPAALIGLLSQPGQLVLDPFCGTGTTLVEAARLGRRTIGADISIIATKIAARRLSLVVDPSVALDMSTPIDSLLFGPLFASAPPRAEVIEGRMRNAISLGPYLTRWFSERQLRDIAELFATSESSALGGQRDFLDLQISHSLRRIAGYTHFGWSHLSDNVYPRTFTASDARQVLASRLVKLRRLFRKESSVERRSSVVQTQVVRADAKQLGSLLRGHEVDLIVTSPPYLGTCDYARSQRLSLPWFGVAPEEEALVEIGSRRNRHRDDFFDDYQRSMAIAFRAAVGLLVPGGILALVLPKFMDERDEAIAALMAVLGELGLRLVYSGHRNIHRTRRGMHWNVDTAVQKQAVTVLQKPCS